MRKIEIVQIDMLVKNEAELSDNDDIKDKISSTEIRKFLSIQKL